MKVPAKLKNRDVSVHRARRWLNKKLDNGIDAYCPCCDHRCKVYERSINTTTAIALIALYRLSDGQPGMYFHVDKIWQFVLEELGYSKRAGDFAKLRHWGIIKECPVSNDEDKKSSGVWCITERGVRYVQGKSKLKKYALVYRREFLGLIGKHVSFRECLKQRFSYKELMRGSS